MYRSMFPVLIAALTVSTALLTSASAEDVERRQIVAVRTGTPPRIDGRLDDSVWQKAQPSEDFIQTKPNRGEPMNQRTVIRVLYDDENIYFGFQCYDTEPEKVLGTEMRRDYEVWETNDYIRFVMDTYKDLRNGYYFGANPLGAKVDARVTDNGNFHTSWDAVWDCAAMRHSQGWSAEFSIPFGQLRFPQKDRHVWGFNCARTIRRNDEEGCWTSIEVDNVNVISSAGELVGLEDLPRGYRLEIRPSIVAGAEGDYDGETDVDVVKEPSLDIKYGLTSGLTLDATVNTDFAQVEADEERVNLSRFDLFFEEKRPFFLEGVGIFGASDPFSFDTLPLFYSRRIGSAEGKEARILGGLKLTGKVGSQSLGMLNVQTGEVDETASTNFSAFRIQRDIFRSSSLGLIFLNKAPLDRLLFSIGSEHQTDLDIGNISTALQQEFDNNGFPLSQNATVLVQGQGSEWRIDDSENGQLYIIRKQESILNIYEDGGYNQTLGADMRFNPMDEVTVFGSLSKTWTDGLHDEDMAGELSGRFQSEHISAGMNFEDIQENFNPEMGFVNRRDIRTGSSWWHVSLPIRRSIFRSVTYDGTYGVSFDHDGELDGRHFGSDGRLELETGDMLIVWYDRYWDNLDYTWELREGITIPADIHRWEEYGVYTGTDSSRWLKLGCMLLEGEYYNGDRQTMSLNGHIRPVPNLLITGDYNRNAMDLTGGSFTTNTINSRWIYNFSPDFYAKLFLQWNDDSDIIRGNFLLRYTYRPGSDLYIVYNEQWQSGEEEQRSIVAKLTYFLNL